MCIIKFINSKNMKTITINLYSFNELSDEVRKKMAEKKRFDVMNDVMECHASEYEESLKEFESATGFIARNWEVCYDKHFFRRSNPDDEVMGSDYNPIYPCACNGRLLWRWCYRFIEGNRRGKYHGKLVPCEKSAEHPNGVRHVKRYSRATMEPITGGWCPWTGVVTDCALVEPIVDFYMNYHRGEYSEDYTLEDLIDDCLEKFFSEWESEYNAYGNNEDGCVEEELENRYNGDWFYANGRRFFGNIEELNAA